MQCGDVYLLERAEIDAEYLTRLLSDNGYTVRRLTPANALRTNFTNAIVLVNLWTARVNLLEFLSAVYHQNARGCIAIGVEPSDEQLLEAVRLGVAGYVDLNRVNDELVPAISAVATGSVWVPRRILRRLLE